MTEATIPMQTTTIACGGCGAALAPDQRYCLHCGTAHSEPRVAYRDLIGPARVEIPTAVSVPPGPPVGAAPLPPRDWTPLIALGTLAALALVLVVGVLIGRSGWDAAPASAPPPQVITISGTAPTNGTGEAAGADDASGSGTGSRAKAGERDKALQQKAVRDQQALHELESSSGADYQRKSAKLPDTVALPGEPPPKDDKAAGGGSEAETIG